jgi:oxygen-independent coproporphyrinogen-3 oxidase
MLGLYLHIPFCQAICSYCNFNRGLLDAGLKTRYVAALAREIEEAGDGREADTIFFGGGTPSLLEPAEAGALIRACRTAYRVSTDAEVTLETNPETVTRDRLAAFRTAGINRLSLGVQSFDDAELQRLGRVHSARRAVEAVADARAAGFDNISLDLMFWLPGQSRASWRASIDHAIDLRPDHVSFYLLELYPNAPLREAMARGRAAGAEGALPSGPPSGAWQQEDDDEAADMYLEALERLDAGGYTQYEISNVARAGRVSRHNLKYWTMGAWRGFGCGAHSTMDGARWRNISATADYADRLERGESTAVDRREPLRDEWAEEAIFTGLRLTAGLDVTELVVRYGRSPLDAYGEDLARYIDAGLMWTAGTRVGLTRAGMLVSNEILATFV